MESEPLYKMPDEWDYADEVIDLALECGGQIKQNLYPAGPGVTFHRSKNRYVDSRRNNGTAICDGQRSQPDFAFSSVANSANSSF